MAYLVATNPYAALYRRRNMNEEETARLLETITKTAEEVEEETARLLDTITNGVSLELAGYCMTMLESGNLPHRERLARVIELLDDMENAVIGASMQLNERTRTCILEED
jgi:hypothetical protein